ncbi:MAG TPA: c-type cytochrome [Gemmatimonadales bacterium]
MARAGSIVACGLASLACAGGEAIETARAATGGDPARGAQAIATYGCGACHVVPGVPGARGEVGPPLENFGRRSYIAGVVVNAPDNLVRWIRSPEAVAPGTAMPNLGVSAGDARDIAAYLYSLGGGRLGPPRLFDRGVIEHP